MNWRKDSGRQWHLNVARIRAEIAEDGAGKFHWKAYEQIDPHHSETGIEDQLAWAKGAAEIFVRDHKKHVPWTHR